MKEKKSYKKRVCFLGGLWLGIFLILLLTNKIQYGERISIVNNNDFYMNVMQYEISDKYEYEQTFQYSGEFLYSFCLKYFYIDDSSNIEWLVQLWNGDENTLIQEWQEKSSTIVSGAFKEYVVSKKFDANSNFVIKVKTEYSGNPIVWICGSDYDSLRQGELEINGIKQIGDFSIQYSEKINVLITIVYGILISGILAIFIWLVVVWHWYKKVAIKVKNCFIYIYQKKKKIFSIVILIVIISLLAILLEYLCIALNVFEPIKTGNINIFRCAFFTVIGLIGLILVVARKYLYLKPEIVISIIFLLIGGLYIFVFPAEAEISWDESIHFWRAVGVSHSTTGLANTAESLIYWKSGIPFGFPTSLEHLRELYENVEQVYRSGAVTAANVDILSSISVIAYVPSAVFLKIARTIGVSFWMVFKIGAFANLALYVTNVYFAIKKLVSGKMILGAVAGIGTGFFLTTVYSYDSWIIGFSLLGIAYFIACMQKKEKITNRELVIMVIALSIAFLPKPVYVPLLLLLLFIPLRKFQNKRQYSFFVAAVLSSTLILGLGIIINSILLLMLWPLFWIALVKCIQLFDRLSKKQKVIFIILTSLILVGGCLTAVIYVLPRVVGQGDLRGGETVNAALQVQQIVSNPLDYLRILFSFLSNSYLTLEHSIYSLFNTLGYLGSTQYHVAGLVILLGVALTDKSVEDNWKRNGIMRIIVLGLGGMSIVLIATALYISYTPVGFYTVMGCQPRYLIPVIYPILALLAPTWRWRKKFKIIYNLTVLILICIVPMLNLWELAVIQYI